jgi:hypothetical protein
LLPVVKRTLKSASLGGREGPLLTTQERHRADLAVIDMSGNMNLADPETADGPYLWVP